jgi:hypothetical protein
LLLRTQYSGVRGFAFGPALSAIPKKNSAVIFGGQETPTAEGNKFFRKLGSDSPKATDSFICQKPETSIFSVFENIQGYEQTRTNNLEEM